VPLYRPNVAALITREGGELLICERWQVPGAWQFPQGGIDPGETPEQALIREVYEEIGLPPQEYEILGSKGGYRYLYPKEVRRKKVRKHGCHGQEQRYFLCRLHRGDAPIDTRQRPREFARHAWIAPGEFDLVWLPPFKREVYRQVMKDFFQVELVGDGLPTAR
jgi:putative (di)nucleoside polyphosphate hydrolase